ncbi:MAG TPA: Crp/Fnr family transcriptional regulator [Nevskia sp.]|nr:Crp/Fnr family transcriptional regulator [Nevskia sp.]
MSLSNTAPAHPLPAISTGLSITDNHLLAALPEPERRQLSLFLELVAVRAGQALSGAGLASTHVWFPLNCIVSMVCTTLDGGSAEVAVIGREGMVGFGMFIGGSSDSSTAMAQCSGFAYRVRMTALKDCFDRSAKVRDLLLQYLQSLLAQCSQAALCNRHHTVEQQLCRWLLSASDRLCCDELAITQESVANTLGVRRAGINEAASRLQRAGLIRYRRGKVELLDRAGLQRQACECYGVLKEEVQRLTQPTRPTPARHLWLQSSRPASPPAQQALNDKPMLATLSVDAEANQTLRSAGDT